MLSNRFIVWYLITSLLIILSTAIVFAVIKPLGNNKCIRGNCKNGYGAYVYNSGMKYEGGWKNGKRYGKGTLTYPDGTKYEGEWKNDRMHGFGIKTSPVFRAYKYIGEWGNGLKHGKGIQYYAPDEWYDGEWRNGKIEGYGEFVVINRDGTIKRTKGIWKDEKLIKQF
ncbi:MAG: hypothetical protein QXT99_09890 [Candidatus Nitrosotenuis sp.]